jgi:hypothetical protein
LLFELALASCALAPPALRPSAASRWVVPLSHAASDAMVAIVAIVANIAAASVGRAERA